MKHKRIFDLAIVLVLVVLLATGCDSLKATAHVKNITITFTSDGKCSLGGPETIQAGKNSIDLAGNSQGHGKIGVAILRFLDPTKTLKDLQDWVAKTTSEPPWVIVTDFLEAPEDNELYTVVVEISQGPIYFACFYNHPETGIGALGPVEVTP